MTSPDCAARAEQARAELAAASQPVTFTAVAACAGIGRATFYRDPALRALIDGRRHDAASAGTLTGLADDITALRTAIEAVAARVRTGRCSLCRGSIPGWLGSRTSPSESSTLPRRIPRGAWRPETTPATPGTGVGLIPGADLRLDQGVQNSWGLHRCALAGDDQLGGEAPHRRELEPPEPGVEVGGQRRRCRARRVTAELVVAQRPDRDRRQDQHESLPGRAGPSEITREPRALKGCAV
jgi:hypothetical protein